LGKREGVLVFIGDAVKMLPFGELAISETLSVRSWRRLTSISVFKIS
jgi:hypothetical protein